MDDERDDPGPNREDRRFRAHAPRQRIETRDQRNRAQQQAEGPNRVDRHLRGRQPAHAPRQWPRDQRNRAQQQAEDEQDVRRRNRSASGQGHRGRNQLRHSISQERQIRDDPRNKIPRKQFLGFKRLEEISNTEPKDTLAKLMENKTAFLELIQLPIERYDMFVLIMKIIAKVCQSSFDETKSKLLLDIGNSNFTANLKNYLMELPWPESKMSNNLYWKNPQSFWSDYMVFYDCIVTTTPTLALKNRSLLEGALIACLSNLKERHGFEMPQEFLLKLVELKERLADFEKRSEATQIPRGHIDSAGAPPEDFRELSVMPTREDLLNFKPYVRANIVNGRYEDVEHYLDVQFRLLREDCFGPLRDGLNQYLRDKTRKRFDNIRVLQNVKFARPYVSQTRIGSLIQVDINSNKMFKRTNWANNKRFIYGSLVLFTKDNCKTFITANILDREDHLLRQGLIPVNIIGEGFNMNIYNDDTYTMFESEVYFEPYYHVLKCLQDPAFPQHLAMKQYIVEVIPRPRYPSYVDDETKFTIDARGRLVPLRLLPMEIDDLMDLMDIEEPNIDKIQFTVLQDETWPNRDQLFFNDSQYDAYKLSLCHEFAVVQGPPGTGKTYLGIQVAKTLIENLQHLEGCLMLVICYTNHALDQFLEALLDISDSIVRIGGQSKNAAMTEISLNKLRSTASIHSAANKAFYDAKIELKDTIATFQKALVRLDVLLNGVVTKDVIKAVQVRYLYDYYERANLNSNPLFYWLFEHYHEYYQHDVGDLLKGNTTDHISFAKFEKDNRKRTGVSLDDEEINSKENMAYRKGMSLFSLEITRLKIKELVAEHEKAHGDTNTQNQIEGDLRVLNAYRTMFNEMSQYRQRRTNIRITPNTNFRQIETIDRWSLYFSWIHDQVVDARQLVGKLQADVNREMAVFEEARMMQDMRVLKNTRIVGMTTSGAARLRKLLQSLNPPIVIVEEAAEVLEQHIITSLTKGCQHLILIGDHQQLRPSASHMKLAKHYGLEVSLFERMINNGIHSRRLSVQHRMRPEIAALICPHIYPELTNHPSVYDFPDVKGITKNLFFYSHDFKEDVVEDNMSRTNHKEADMTLALAQYLMQQGYKKEDVTILAAYKGQMFYMRKESDNYPYLKDVKITVVDNYQGEESKIILLSLVRNNEDNKIGFLGTPNRICVALSRAKHGFYIFGNIDTLKASSDLWKNIAGTLEKGNFLGTTLTLQCQNHKDNMTIIKEVGDFQNVPEGGCLLLCEASLPQCGHKCPLRCHGYDREHNTNATRCMKPCERIQCVLEHVCPKRCNEDCGPCQRKVLKELPCGHEMRISCYLEPEDPKVKCLTMLDVTLPDCQHQAKKFCHEDIKVVRCEVNCEFRVEKCGHSCLRKCHVKDDANHEKYLCMKRCAKAKGNCRANLDGDRGDHQCRKMCHESCETCEVMVKVKRTTCKHTFVSPCHVDPDSIPCIKKCAGILPCGHFCKEMCKDPCGYCKIMVTKEIPGCKHKVKLECRVEPTNTLCTQKCERIMTCGHKCTGICGEECNPKKCNMPSVRKVNSPCGHLVSLPCNIASLPAAEVKPETVMAACTATCAEGLECKHVCQGTCAGCRRGRLHERCRQPCNQYNVCSHSCSDPCNQTCPPCRKTCEIRCKHSKCNKLCGEPCTICQENCSRVCVHGACTNRCGEPCSRKPCDEPCPLELPCGHPCRGLCGETCPPFCNRCLRDTFPVDYFGDPFDDTDRLVLLEDCGHVMEVESMDSMMMSERDGVKIPCCPYIDPVVCRKPIVNTGRYKDLVTWMFKNEINPIKEKVFGSVQNIKDTNQKLRADLGSYRAKYLMLLDDNKDLKNTFMHLTAVVKKQKNVSKLQLDMELVCLDIMEMTSACYNSYIQSKLTVLKEELAAQVKLICQIFDFKNNVLMKISMQQRNDIKLEIQRLNAIVQLAKLISHPAYTPAKSQPSVSGAYEKAKSSVFSYTIFKNEETMAALKKMQEAIRVSGVVTKQEREMVVRAVGLKAGHWFYCPNGHPYCIGECGGAMQVGKCPECGAAVGGTSHRLLGDNRHARDLDGSQFAAWSEQYNNMANFDME